MLVRYACASGIKSVKSTRGEILTLEGLLLPILTTMTTINGTASFHPPPG